MSNIFKIISSLVLVYGFISAGENSISSSIENIRGQLLEADCFLELDLLSIRDELLDTVSRLDRLYDKQLKDAYKDFDRSLYFTKEEKKAIKPYLLPFNHPIKPSLDAIFNNQRATLDGDTFSSAGFVSKFIQPRSFIRVASHPSFPGYLVKVYLDDELRIKKNIPGWKWLTNRAKNAKIIRRFIKENNFKYFTAPQKWIYPLPIDPSPPNDPAYSRKNEILVVEDMELVPENENLEAWKTIITEKHLEELYQIITHASGSSYRADNVAYTKSGKFAFIDTEYAHKAPNFNTVHHYLSPEMGDFWKNLTGLK